MRIARVLTRLNLGGPARQVLASDPRLVARGHELRIFCGTPEAGEGDLFDEAVALGLDVVRVPGLRRGIAPLRDHRALRFLRRELAQFRPDVVHTHASKAGLLGRRAAPAGAALVHTFHGHVLEGYFPGPVERRLQATERKLARLCARILAVSHATADDLLRLDICPEEQLVVVPPGTELEPLLALPAPGEGQPGELRRLIGADENAFVVGVIGRLAPVKRPELAVDVFELLHDRYPRLHLVFVGDGNGRMGLERRLQSLPNSSAERCHLVGGRAEPSEFLAELDAVLSTSSSEGMPIALIEAAAAARPVVATPVGGVPELVVHERTGFLGEDVTELGYHLDALLRDSHLVRAVGQRARMRVQKRHSGESLAGRLEDVYKIVVEERRP